MKPAKKPPYAYVNRYYGVNVGVGQRVQTKGEGGGAVKDGIVVSKRSYDQYVHVKFDGTKFDVPVHPLDLDYNPEKAKEKSVLTPATT